MTDVPKEQGETGDKRKPEVPRYAFFQHVFEGGNEFILRCWARFDVQAKFKTSCEGCTALLETLETFPCIRKIHRIQAKGAEHCHRLVDIISIGREAYVLGSLKMPKTVLKNVFHRELSADLRIKKPFRPLAHQREFVEVQFDKSKVAELPKGILLGLELGSGKTHTALYLAHDRGCAIISVVCAVSLIGQWVNSIQKHAPASVEAPVVEYRVFGYNRFDALVAKDHRVVAGQHVIVDEAHHFKNMTDVMEPAIRALELSSCCQLLTGTAVRNDVRDFDFVLRMLGHGDLIPDFLEGEAGRGDRAWAANGAPPPDPYANVDLLKRIRHAITGRVAMYSAKYCDKRQKFLEHYPQTEERTVFHTLTWPQCLERFLFGDGVSVRFREGGRKVNIGISGGVLRRLSIYNAVRDEETGELFSSKADALIAEIERIGAFPIVVYSRFKANLLKPLTQRVKEHFSKRVGLMTGDTPQQERQPLMDAYNREEIDVLLLCSVGSEGLDLTAPTKALIILEPQNNIPEEDQIAGRVVRFSKSKRTPEQQKTPIQIVKFVCRFPEKGAEPKSEAEKDFLLEVVNGHPGIVEGMTGKRPTSGAGGNIPLRDIVGFLQRKMREVKRTDEEVMYDTNLQKKGRTQALKVLLWNASQLCGRVPPPFKKEWLEITGELPSENGATGASKVKENPAKRNKK